MMRSLFSGLDKDSRVEIYVKEFIKEKCLDGNRMGSEMSLLATMLDKSLEEPPVHWVDYQTAEIALRRLHAIERSFSNVHCLSDWKAQKGQKGWKAKVLHEALMKLPIGPGEGGAGE